MARVAPDPDDARVLQSYFPDGRLTTIPVQAVQREVARCVLRARVFTQDRTYPEKEVKECLALFHGDAAALRRYLVDEGLVMRDAAGTAYRRVPD